MGWCGGRCGAVRASPGAAGCFSLLVDIWHGGGGEGGGQTEAPAHAREHAPTGATGASRARFFFPPPPPTNTHPPPHSRYNMSLEDERELAYRRLRAVCRSGLVSMLDFR